MPMPKVWTLEESNAVLPDLSFRIGRQMVLLAEIQAMFQRLEARIGAIDEAALDPADDDDEDVAAQKERLRDELDKFKQGWREIEGKGVIVKDPRIGLIDFYGQIEGEIVFLCWQYGESAVAHYHSLDGGFASRQPIETLAAPRTLN